MHRRRNLIKNNYERDYYKKCAFHDYSYNYLINQRKFKEIFEYDEKIWKNAESKKQLDIKIIFHIMFSPVYYDNKYVIEKVYKVISTLNDHFNSYSNKSNTMNNFKYKGVINREFANDYEKQMFYFSDERISEIPVKSSNINFELGEIFYYSNCNSLSFKNYNNVSDVELQMSLIKRYIFQHQANAISPDNFLNIWIIDYRDTNSLGYSNFPWEPINEFHGIYINIRAFFPEKFNEETFDSYSVFTHHVGHYLGLMHNHFGNDNLLNNINLLEEKSRIFIPESLKVNTHDISKTDFVNFMSESADSYTVIFTKEQLQIMRYMISKYRPYLLVNKSIPEHNDNVIFNKREIIREKIQEDYEEFSPENYFRLYPHQYYNGVITENKEIVQEKEIKEVIYEENKLVEYSEYGQELNQ